MTMKRQSLKLDEIDWQVLMGIAADCGCEYRGTPSWRRLFDDIASGKLSVVNRPDKRVRDFQAKLRRPMIEQRQKQETANWTARSDAKPRPPRIKAAVSFRHPDSSLAPARPVPHVAPFLHSLI